MKIKHQLELLYLQVDEGLMCMDIVSTFRDFAHTMKNLFNFNLMYATIGVNIVQIN
jgi:hypothetical protein